MGMGMGRMEVSWQRDILPGEGKDDEDEREMRMERELPFGSAPHIGTSLPWTKIKYIEGGKKREEGER